MMHRWGVFFWALTVPLVSAAESRLNVLFILTEDQGAHMGALGTAGIETPHMDALAASGVLFRNAYVAYPVCSASKAAIYTSLHNHTNGLLNNTANNHKAAEQLTEGERKREVYRDNRIDEQLPTLVERLKAAGYYQGVTHKLHVAPNEKFPYDEFIEHSTGREAAAFLQRATATGKPWHLFYNIAVSHRPFPNSDVKPIRVTPDEVELPPYLPDTAVVRKDWAEYLAAIEAADQLVGEVMTAVREAGELDRTVVVFLGDHGPCFAHGKMTLHELGLRVPLVFAMPGGQRGVVSDAVASELDLTPTLLDVLGLPPLEKAHGVSLRSVVEGSASEGPREFAFAEVSNLGPLPNEGMQERSVSDGHWKMIYREKVETGWRQVNADSILWKPWRNRSYDETVRLKAEFPEAFRILAEMHPQGLGGTVPVLELYDLQSDPHEMTNLAADPAHAEQRDRMQQALAMWVVETADPAVDATALRAR